MFQNVRKHMVKGTPEVRRERIEEMRQYFETLVEANGGTHDGPMLQKRRYQDVFIYGTLKQGFRSHHLIKDAECLGCGWTNTPTYSLYECKAGGYPVLMPAVPGEGYHVYGEVWRIPTQKIFNLDYFESNGYMYQRSRIYVRMFDKGAFNRRANCWTYLGIPGFWKQRMHQLNLMQRHKREKEPKLDYYIWTKRLDDLHETNARMKAMKDKTPF